MSELIGHDPLMTDGAGTKQTNQQAMTLARQLLGRIPTPSRQKAVNVVTVGDLEAYVGWGGHQDGLIFFEEIETSFRYEGVKLLNGRPWMGAGRRRYDLAAARFVGSFAELDAGVTAHVSELVNDAENERRAHEEQAKATNANDVRVILEAAKRIAAREQLE